MKKGLSGMACAIAVVFISLAGFASLAAQQPGVSIVDIAKAQQTYVAGLRHEFHQHPEVRWTEEWTLGRVRSEINTLLGNQPQQTRDYSFESKGPAGQPLYKGRLYELKGGLVVDLDFNPAYDRILMRADVDALPVTEATGLPFASQLPGVMHACGHDTHAAMLLGFLKTVIDDGQTTPKHNLRLVFERSEENPFDGRSGALTLVGENVLDGVSAAYGLHIWVGSPGKNGLLMSRPGPVLANNDQFFVTIRATGGHVALPHEGSNAIEIATVVMDALKGFADRWSGLGPMAPASIVPAAFLAGNETQANVRPAEAKLTYSARTYLIQADREKLAAALEQKVRDTVKQFPDANVEFKYTYGYPATINTPTVVSRVSGLAQAAIKYEETQASLGGESFGYYTQKVPGAVFYLAAWQQGTGGHHSPTFNPDESVLWQGVAYWLTLATN